MENNEYFYKQTIDSMSEKQIIKDINFEIVQASSKGLFVIDGEYDENEIDIESFIEYFKNLGFKITVDYDKFNYKWKYRISWFKHF
jgi:hypothetical protein